MIAYCSSTLSKYFKTTEGKIYKRWPKWYIFAAVCNNTNDDDDDVDYDGYEDE